MIHYLISWVIIPVLGLVLGLVIGVILWVWWKHRRLKARLEAMAVTLILQAAWNARQQAPQLSPLPELPIDLNERSDLVLAWRFYSYYIPIKGTPLLMGSRGMTWLEATAVAKCPLNDLQYHLKSNTDSLYLHCGCGIWAYKDISSGHKDISSGHTVPSSPDCIALCALYGTIQEAELGYRAEKCRILKLYPGRREVIIVIQELAQYYNVPGSLYSPRQQELQVVQYQYQLRQTIEEIKWGESDNVESTKWES